uniref:Histone-lysine N-methyltransferase SMYD3 n=1 Tax=Cacopsylla melanoneura TaxID=428564 RepID=A0A8D8YDI3_9HEMI
MSDTKPEGTLLLTEKPFVFVLHNNQKVKRCDHCFESGDLSNCSLCDKVAYCSSKCEAEAWSVHKFECPNMKRISPKIVPDAVRMIARIIYKLKYCKGWETKGFYGSGRNEFRKFSDLESHYEDLQHDRKRLQDFLSLSSVLKDFMGENESLPPPSELLNIYGRLLINSFNIMDISMNTIGSGLYLGTSRFDHSCSPNAVAVFSSTTISIRLTKPMEQFDWSKVFVSYIDVLQPTSKRIGELNKGYYFECCCEVCQDVRQLEDMLSMSCPNTNCLEPIYIPEDIQDKVPECPKCTKCGEQVTQSRLDSYLNALDFIEAQLDRMKQTSYLDVCQTSLRKTEGLFHPYNVYQLQILDSAFSAAIDLNHWTEAKEYGKKLILGQKKYYGDIHPLLGQTLLKTVKILLLEENEEEYEREMVQSYIEHAERIVKICYGEEHSLYKDHVIPLLDNALSF